MIDDQFALSASENITQRLSCAHWIESGERNRMGDFGWNHASRKYTAVRGLSRWPEGACLLN